VLMGHTYCESQYWRSKVLGEQRQDHVSNVDSRVRHCVEYMSDLVPGHFERQVKSH
jgi:hypothetical protein